MRTAASSLARGDARAREDRQTPLGSQTDIEARDHHGRLALIIAVENNHAYAVKLLLDYGANRSQADGNGRTALFAAVESNRVEAVKILLGAGARAEATRPPGS